MRRRMRSVTTFVAIVFVLGYSAVGLGQTLSGRVYEGQKGSEPPPLGNAKPIEGVTVSLYGSNSANDNGTGQERLPIQTTTTNGDGWYGLTIRDAYDFYNIIQTNLATHVDSDPSPAATSVGGTVKSSNWIQYSYESLFVDDLPATTTGNKFWDKLEGQPPANQPPVANNDSATTRQDTPVTISVLSNDSDPDGDILSITAVGDPPHGSTTHNGQTIAYAPDAGFIGTDAFSYVVGDGRGGTESATVTVTVLSATSPAGEIRGMVFHDLTGDGEMGPDESGLAGWTVFLDDDWDRVAGSFEQRVWTDAEGRFVFSGLDPGTYRVDQVVEDGWQQVWPLGGRGEPVAWVVAVEAGQVVQANFGNIKAGSVPGNEEDGLELVAGPDVEHVSPREVVITWQTNVESTGIVYHGHHAGLYWDQAEEPVWAAVHRLVLVDLSPSTVYHFVLTCIDRAEDQLTTGDSLFETLPEPDRSPPSLTLNAPGRPVGVVVISAQAEDDTGIDRVAFFLDDNPILIDYTPPYEAPVDTTQYGNGPHSVAARAHDRAGKQTTTSQDMDIGNLVEAMGPSVRITSHKTGDSVSGQIQIKADVTDDKGLWKAEFYVDGNLLQQEVFGGPIPPRQAEVQFSLDTRQVSKEILDDPHDIAVQAWDTAYQDGAHAIRLYVSNVTPIPQYPWLKVIGHTVSRTQNHFAISLVVQNQGTQTVHDVVIRVGMTGFQVISGGSAGAQWVGRYNPVGRFGYCEIHGDDIPASAQRTYTYHAVPVLQHPSVPPPKIGHFIYLDYSGPPPAGQDYSASDPWPVLQVTSSEGTQGLQEAHQYAVGLCDYLIVTNPYRLYAMFNPGSYQGPTQATADVHSVLSHMAELAFYKQGALGYNDQYDVASLLQLIHVGGAWSGQLAGGWASNGYLLIVGETEIVPAQGKKFTYEYTGGTQVWDFVSDYRYASTSGDEEWPELSIGRIIGNTAGALGTALQTGLGGKAFDRSHSLLVSGHPGSGDNAIDFKSWVEGALTCLAGQFVPPLTAQTVLDQPTTATLLASMADQDVIFLAGHGNAGSWNGVTTADVQGQANLFGTTSPFVFAHACQTGRYAGAFCLAEAFLSKGAAVYLGATDSAGWGQYSNAFFRLWGMGESVGLAVKKTKQGIGDSIEDRLWSQTYHVFGDPKFGASGISSSQTVAFASVTSCAADGNEAGPIDVVLGDCETTEVNGQVHLTLPQGQVLSILDMPLVPYVAIRRSYPHGTQIQQVSLEELSDPVVTTDIELARATAALPGAGGGTVTSSAEPTWWPDRLFDPILPGVRRR